MYVYIVTFMCVYFIYLKTFFCGISTVSWNLTASVKWVTPGRHDPTRPWFEKDGPVEYGVYQAENPVFELSEKAAPRIFSGSLF